MTRNPRVAEHIKAPFNGACLAQIAFRGEGGVSQPVCISPILGAGI